MAFVEFKKVKKCYVSGSSEIYAANSLSFEINKGELCVVLGPSGAGKTTMLNLLGGMERADSGEIILDGKKISSLSDRELTLYRRNDIGFVFQFYNLVENLTASENVELATALCRSAIPARKALEQVGLALRADHFPAQLSGGEQQRVSIARAIAKNPKILLCDEPTGALDYRTGKNILALLEHKSRVGGKTVVIITHNSAIAKMADRVIKFKNGAVEECYLNERPISAEELEW